MGGMWAIYPFMPDLSGEKDHNTCQNNLVIAEDTHYQGAPAHETCACATVLGRTKSDNTDLFNHKKLWSGVVPCPSILVL
ncbi:MAG: hypothetical protein ABW104_00545 [Candidatus Thiodiazotropha sp. 6PLUC2]